MNEIALAELIDQQLRRVRTFGHPDVVGIDGIYLEFDAVQISVFVNADEDSLEWRRGSVFPNYPEQIEKEASFWSKFLNQQVIWIWEMQNQTGCRDALQMLFTSAKNEHLIVQLLAMSSTMLVFDLREVRSDDN